MMIIHTDACMYNSEVTTRPNTQMYAIALRVMSLNASNAHKFVDLLPYINTYISEHDCSKIAAFKVLFNDVLDYVT